MGLKSICIIFCFLFLGLHSFSQYFQQEVNYKINVSLDDVNHELNANESIEYVNNSPNTLNEIYFHLWPNAYKNNSTALSKQLLESGSARLYFASDSLRGYIDKLDFKVNEKPVKVITDSLNIDICKLILNEPLTTGEKIVITTPFHVKIPAASFSRLGHTGQAYYITQWYPKPAVYDEKGWHAFPYLNQGEFYSEFGSFEVTLTVPKNYVVGATGDLQNVEEQEWINRKVLETMQIKNFPSDMSFPKSDQQTKTLIYKQSGVHDFAWMADKRFHILKSEIELPHSKNKVATWAMFTNAQANLWVKSTEYVDSALYYYSLWNGDYPYKNCTILDGTIAAGAGMEYPNITIIGSASNAFELEDVIAHEVGHNWFYGLLGSNEREHAWMDEGINSFYELRYITTRYPGKKTNGLNDLSGLGIIDKIIGSDKINFKSAFDLECLAMARINKDQPLNITSPQFTELNYGLIVYRKTALLFNYLKSYLGDSLFDACMKIYFDEWKFKHPYPNDLKKVFVEGTGKNLDWFFYDLINRNKKIDYSITKVHPLKAENIINPVGHSFGVTFKNKGEVVSPFTYSFLKNNQVISTNRMEGFSGKKEIQLSCLHCDEIRIDNYNDIPEINKKNNTIRTSGILRKIEPVQFKFFGQMEDGNRTQLFFLPIVGWNNYNKTMTGVALYNKFIPHKKFEYIFLPMYSFGTKSLAGTLNFSYTFYLAKTFIHHIKFSASANHYSFNSEKTLFTEQKTEDLNFTNVPVDITFTLRKKYERSTIDKNITLRNFNIWVDEIKSNTFDFFKKTNSYFYFHQTLFTFNNHRTLDPYRISLTLENGEKYMKSNLEATYKFPFKNINKGVDIRFFIGTFVFNNEKERNYNYRMSAWRGTQDYLFDDIYLGRSEFEGKLSQQTYIHDGGFKLYSPVGQSNKWIASLNFMIDFPGKIPLSLFADMGTYDGAKNAFDGSQTFMYDGGVCVSIIKNVAEIYFPLFKSSDIKQALDANDIKYKEQIRFLLNFKLMNPFRLREKLLQQ